MEDSDTLRGTFDVSVDAFTHLSMSKPTTITAPAR